jgi:hypothetical protein
MIPTPKQKIVKLVTQMRHYNFYPIDLPDLEYSETQKHPFLSLFNDIVSEVHEYLLIADEDELKATHKELMPFFREQIESDLLLAGDEQTLTLTAQYIVATVTQKSYFDVKYYIASEYRDNSEILTIYPEIANYEDDEGLLPLGSPGFKPAHMLEGGIYYKNHVLYYHQFLRRNFSSNLNFPFLNALIAYHKDHKEHHVAVALDHLRIVTKEGFRQIFEKDHAFGPPLALTSLLDNPHEVGLTVHRFPDERQVFLYGGGIERTEFYWSIKHNDTKKSFEIEEVYSLNHLPDIGDDLVLTRYVHSIRDINAHAFIHLDGAVKIYRRNQYQQRYVSEMPKELKAEKKIKVFRVDADTVKGQAISDNEWSKLIGYFFRGNILVTEYLNPNFRSEASI